MKMVSHRSATNPNVKMWGMHHIDAESGEVVGWLFNSWTERGVSPYLPVKLHWLAKDNNKLQRAILNFDSHTIDLCDDGEPEPYRETFIRSTVSVWEEEYMGEQLGRPHDS